MPPRIIERRVRWYQQAFHKAWVTGARKRLIEIAHRRWGKDEIAMMATCEWAHKRIGTYWHCLPEYAQARKAIWTSVNAHTGKRRIDEAFPAEIIESRNDQEMFIRLKCGSTWQLIGSDRYDATVGSGPVGITYSEWALANPNAWGYHRPMVEENDGWAAFITTPRGRNHAYNMYNEAARNPDRWFAELSPVGDTRALSEQQLSDALSDYIGLYGDEDLAQAQIDQEYHCSFNAAILGAFYAKQMLAVRNEGRIAEIEHIEGSPVHTAWDLGKVDSTAIWWFQVVGSQVFILDFYMSHGADIEHYADICLAKPWKRGIDYVPHDAKQQIWGMKRGRVEQMRDLGLKPVVLPQNKILDGIAAARKTLPLCVFHPRTEPGIQALEQYRREWDEDARTFGQNPVHDWCFAGDTKVLTRCGMHRIMDLRKSGEVLTPCGWRPYTNPRITRRAAPLVEVAFSDGLTVRCTPDHMFLTDGGWKSAESLKAGSLIQSCLTLSRFISMAAYTVDGQAKGIGRAVARSCIERFGELLSGLSRTVATSITLIATPATIVSAIWNVCQLRRTFRTHGPKQSQAVSLTSISATMPVARPQNGTPRTKEGFGIDAMPSGRKVGKSGSGKRNYARLAMSGLMRWFGKAVTVKSIAAKFAKWRRIESVVALDEAADVWCITVPGQESFALSNGAVVHNCSHAADAFRYMAMSWRSAPREIPDDKPKRQPGQVYLPGPPEPMNQGYRIRI